ncbi:PTS sugar transporter subunit IIC [Clostridium paraputrificum]|uniref:PTS sugar transporter subunit IIC n=1 Tax=Clostridium TaxID=1485 RepID=UPI00232D6C65|nr:MULTISPECIES: PTS sugar transporter subunit IIC [Clostridium]MDB2090073.1 PTS sugar transporter subunit IIC [Clostridium paraputrificum]MDB2096488.1 PTS sugar transporter subunit IIC [Clostridium paraputrificum]MDU1179147.1 PTS sugar transporter subunit IIC [Clostridium sp.]MDU1226363.1 PTS sugar transporter subunit IIC [Clostridium sp.]MDU7652430.1 PTS sugar transporter subunit IIC [Clostridium sp.]
MNFISNFIEEKMVPVVSKFASLRYMRALKSGFMVIMPLTIIASVFLLITDFPITGYPEFMEKIFGPEWDSFLSPAYRATFDMMGILLAGTIAYKLAESDEVDPLPVMIISIVAYVIVTPKFVTAESGEVINKVLPMAWLGTKGVITAIIMSITSTEIYRFIVKKNLVIKLPENVPPMVYKSFFSLVPGVIVVAFALLVNGIFLTMGKSMHEFIYDILQVPLQGLTASPIAITIVAGLNGFLWWFGIHPTVVNSIVNPLLNANSVENLELFKQGALTLENANIGTIQMIDQFATIGGAGMTIGLVLAMLVVAKSQRMKMLSKLSTVPAVFNINEPIVFGLPIIMNPLMLIPITLAPIVSVLIAYGAIVIGFMNPFNGVVAPWPTPPIFSGFLVSGWQGAVVQVVAIIAAFAIYYPFVLALDKQYRAEEVA